MGINENIVREYLTFNLALNSIVANGNEIPKHVPFLKKENYFSKEIVTARDVTSHTIQV